MASVSIPFRNLNQRRILCNAKNGPIVVALARRAESFPRCRMQKKLRRPRGIDTTAVLLLSALVGAALIYFGYFTQWEFGVWLFVLKGLLWVEVV